MFSDPVVGNKFFGRAEVLELLSMRVGGLKDGYRQNIAILGPDLIGKSSLILQFLSNFSSPCIIPIYIDLGPWSFNHFAYKFIGTLLYQYLKSQNIKVSTELDLLRKYAKKHIPKTEALISIVEDDIKNLQFDEAYKRVLSLTAVFEQETGILCIVIFDEFHFLDSYKLKNFFSEFAREIMLQKNTMYILISSQVSYARKILSNEISLLFGNFEIVELRFFDYATSCKFLEMRFQDVRLPHDFKDFLIAFSEGHPFYLDILSNKVEERIKQQNGQEISAAVIGQAFNSLIYDSQGILNQYFNSILTSRLNGGDYSEFLPVLLSASTKGSRLEDITKNTLRQSGCVFRQTKYLVDKDLLCKVGVFYRFQDRMFRFWLKSTYQRKNKSLSTDPAAGSGEFLKEIEEKIDSFSRETKRPLVERLADIFVLSGNDSILIQNKLLKFWKFEEVRICSDEKITGCILARYKDKYWACQVRADGFSESDLHQFYSYCLNSGHKISKKIIVSLRELDLNVKLMALEKKMLIWTAVDLNLLFDLYGKEPVFCKQ